MGHPSHLNIAQVMSTRFDQEPEDAVFEEVPQTTERKTTLRTTEPRSLLTHYPFLRAPRQGLVEVMGYRDDGGVFPWGFWGGCALIAITIGLVVLRGSSGLFSLMDLLIALAMAGLAAALLRWGPRDSLRAHLLASVDTEGSQLTWPGPSGQAQLVLPFEEITEIVFAMIYFPVSPSRPDSRIHVFTLLVRQGDDQLIPIIEASPNKEATYELAQMLSQWTHAPISEVGEGILSNNTARQN